MGHNTFSDALIGLFQEGESIADFQEGDFLEGGSDRGGCIIMMCDVCLFVCFVVSGVAPARIQQICRNIYNLEINTTLSRTLLTSKPDTKIGRTIVINSGQRSIYYRASQLNSWLFWKIRLPYRPGFKHQLMFPDVTV